MFEPAGGPGRPTSNKVEVNSTPAYVEPIPMSFSFRRTAPVPKIDVKPEDDANTIDPEDTGNLEVAILSTQGFDARTADCGSIRLGPNEARPLDCRMHDVDRNGRPDLVARFSIPAIGLQCGDAFLYLTVHAGNGTITGQDFVRLTGCNMTATPAPRLESAPAAEDAP